MNWNRFWVLLAVVSMIVEIGSLQRVIAQGDLLICSPDTHSVIRIDRDTGTIIGDFVAPSSGGLQLPSGLAYGPDGNLYVSDGPNGKVLRYNGRTGAFIDLFAHDAALFGPSDLEFYQGNLYVAMWSNASGLAGGVARLNGTTGALDATFGVENNHRVSSIEFDANGELYASSYDASDIRVFDPISGTMLRSMGNLGTFGRPMGMSFGDDDNLYVNDWTGNFRIIDPQSGALVKILLTGIGTNQANRFAPDGSLIVDNFFGRHLDKYDPMTGQFLGVYATLPGQLEKFIFMPLVVPEPNSLVALASIAWLVCLRRGDRNRG